MSSAATVSTPLLTSPMPVPSQINNYKLMEKKFVQIRTPPRSIGSQTETGTLNIDQENKRDQTNSTSSDIAYSISPPTIKFIIGASPTQQLSSLCNTHFGKDLVYWT